MSTKSLDAELATLLANHAAASRARLILNTIDTAYDLPTMALEGYDRAEYAADGEGAVCDAADALGAVLDEAGIDIEDVLEIAAMTPAKAAKALARRTRIIEAAQAIATIQAQFHGDDADELFARLTD